MKRIKYLLFGLISFVLLTAGVSAAPSYSVSAPSSVEKGKRFTVTVNVKNTSGWVIRIVPSGVVTCDSSEWSGNTENGENTSKSFSTSCRGTATGIAGFRISGNISDSSYQTSNLSKEVRVNVVEPRKASTNNALKSLGVEGYELTPAFDSEVLEYNLSVPSTVKENNPSTTVPKTIPSI